MINLRQIFLVFLKIGIYSFNAGASEVLLIQIVEKKRWLDYSQYSQILSIATLIPGPFHVNLAIATGNMLAGLRGGLLAAVGFTLPGFSLAVTMAYALNLDSVSTWLHHNPGFSAGIVAAVSGLLLSAIIRLGQRTLSGIKSLSVVIVLIACIYLLKLSFALVIIGSGLIYLIANLLMQQQKEK